MERQKHVEIYNLHKRKHQRITGHFLFLLQILVIERSFKCVSDSSAIVRKVFSFIRMGCIAHTHITLQERKKQEIVLNLKIWHILFIDWQKFILIFICEGKKSIWWWLFKKIEWFFFWHFLGVLCEQPAQKVRIIATKRWQWWEKRPKTSRSD
jgi:hypothetical protein